MCYAHTRSGCPSTQWEKLNDHLDLVAVGNEVLNGAADFAETFGARQWGGILGRWHDLGKYSEEFQNYLLCSEGDEAHCETIAGRVDHSTAGAQHATRLFGASIGRLLAYAIAGHHGGLPDNESDDGGASSLSCRLRKAVPSIATAPQSLLAQSKPPLPPFEWGEPGREAAFRLSVFCRMLFSCLVDADYLATESFMQPQAANARATESPTPSQLLPILDAHLDDLQAGADAALSVNKSRADVLDACRKAAEHAPGLFSLTVPTGGGKTLSSLAFALKHAVQYDLRRVVYAVPFTSIIEQNAAVFREALATAGPQAILEHHFNIDAKKETRWSRFAAENWDAPIIVTTNVQLYESLFANKPSRCRKLHRIARSVIVLDEVQSLPVELLRPTLAMLDALRRNYGCTIVLCSATQPAAQWREEFKIGLRDVREIIDDVPALFASLKRVEVTRQQKTTDEELVEQLAQHNRVLCIVNTRGHAAGLYKLLRERQANGVFHLSAQMCPAHRSDTLKAVRACLEKTGGAPCRVISTQVVEAGVDIDFPVVYRAMAGLDSIAQAAGRCNREGRLDRGRVFAFETDTEPQFVRRPAQDTREIAAIHDDLFSLDAIHDYFALHYWKRSGEWDEHDVMSCFSFASRGMPHFQFRTAAERYRLIPDEQQPVFVPYGDKGKRLLDEVRQDRVLIGNEARSLRRRLQQFAVGVYEYQLQQLISNGVVAIYHDQYWVLENAEAYSDGLGLRLDIIGLDPEACIV